MISKSEIENALSELEDGETTSAIEILKYLLNNGNFIIDLCDCDFDAKDECEDCTCGLAHWLDLEENDDRNSTITR